MPKVGDKEFAYTPEGIAAAKAEADMTGESMEIVDAMNRSESYELGGKIPGQAGFGERPLRPMPGDLTPPTDPGPFGPGQGNVGDRDWFDDPRKGGGAYKKGGKVSNRNPVGVDPIPEPEYRGQSLGRSYQEWKKGGKVSKGKKPSAY